MKARLNKLIHRRIWIDATGCEHYLPNMEERYLRNVKAFLERHMLKEELEGLSALSFFQGEMAIMSVESVMEQTSELYLDAINTISAELDQRLPN